jgi:hypothetical protein
MKDAVLRTLNEALMLAQFRVADLGNRRGGEKTWDTTSAHSLESFS